ncbi:multiple organellar RNA editing factor 8, chloroplastic/mitochondrial-like protein [Tanacetum coccineum]
MTTRVLLRRLISKTLTLTTLHYHSFSTATILRLRPLITAAAVVPTSSRAFSTSETTSSLNDPTPNWEIIVESMDGCDFEHWLVVVGKPEGEPTRDEIIESYINTLAKAVGISYDDARMKIYSVWTTCYYAFGALMSEEDSYKLKELPGVCWVLPYSYLNVENKQYVGEPFIDGKAVPYDPKYHEEWIRENAGRRLQESKRNRRNDKE